MILAHEPITLRTDITITAISAVRRGSNRYTRLRFFGQSAPCGHRYPLGEASRRVLYELATDRDSDSSKPRLRCNFAGWRDYRKVRFPSRLCNSRVPRIQTKKYGMRMLRDFSLFFCVLLFYFIIRREIFVIDRNIRVRQPVVDRLRFHVRGHVT